MSLAQGTALERLEEPEPFVPNHVACLQVVDVNLTWTPPLPQVSLSYLDYKALQLCPTTLGHL